MTDSNEIQMILASASPRRGELLRQIGITFDTCPVDIDESFPGGEAAVEHAMHLALAKADAAHSVLAQQANTLPVLAADTVVEIDGEVLGKPADRGQARAMLARLSGRSHSVHTAVVVVHEQRRHSAVSTSQVHFAELADDVIEGYIDTDEPYDKAGGYGIQGIAGQFVRSIQGSYSGIMGLPLYETAQLLAASGVRTLIKPER